MLELAGLFLFFLPTFVALTLGRPVWRIFRLNLLVVMAVFAWPVVLFAAFFDVGD